MSGFIINIFGPMTAGKSTTAIFLKAHIERLYTVDFDVVKRQISNYYSPRDHELANEITYDTLASVAKSELPIVALLPPPKDQASYERISDIAKQNGRRLINIEITAPLEVLVKRYTERIKSVTESGNVIRLRTPEEFKHAVKSPYYKPTDSHVIDSSLFSPEEIFEQVKSLL